MHSVDRGPGGLESIAASPLPPHDTVFAMAVLKSQGPEFNRAIGVAAPAAADPDSRVALHRDHARAGGGSQSGCNGRQAYAMHFGEGQWPERRLGSFPVAVRAVINRAPDRWA